jgi:23S rRNA (adenine2503-C2)-methyltransferase
MQLINTIPSSEDASVNFIFENNVEARFVQRSSDYFICYLSSHNGCNKSCRFCHLTQTGQTKFDEVNFEEYLEQAKTVLDYYSTKVNENKIVAAHKVHFNFMARGEPLANSCVLEQNSLLTTSLINLAKEYSLTSRINFSSIIPTECEYINFNEVFKDNSNSCSIYYSLYSVNQNFRKKWIPKSLDFNIALKKLESLQQNTGIDIVFHWAFINGENDSKEDIEHLFSILNNYKIKAKFNLVRYNPFSDSQGKESEEHILLENFDNLKAFFKHPDSRIVPRVGFDVKASCGMFVS